MSLNSYNSTLVLFTAVCHGNPGADKNFAGSSSEISKQIFLKFLKICANSNKLL